VVDEVGYLSYGPDAANVLFQVVNERHLHRRPMVFTTNKPVEEWGRVLHDPDLAEAILDRVLERGRVLHFKGPSYRTRDSVTAGVLKLSRKEGAEFRELASGPPSTARRRRGNTTAHDRAPPHSRAKHPMGTCAGEASATTHPVVRSLNLRYPHYDRRDSWSTRSTSCTHRLGPAGSLQPRAKAAYCLSRCDICRRVLQPRIRPSRTRNRRGCRVAPASRLGWGRSYPYGRA
jgi:hypothetical protein